MAQPLLEVNGVSKTYGKQVVLNDISFQIAQGKKIALIGRNGAGKSTLLKILIDEVEADTGSVKLFDWTRVGVIHQNEVLPTNKSSLEYLEELSAKPSWEVRKLGAKFGLHDDHLTKSPGQLSGGYQMRIKLTGMFLQDPNLLFLDEPVNYLDLQTILLLENVLADYKGSFVLVAHDRTFLQNTCDAVYEIERGKLTTYNGDIQSFLKWKQEQAEFTLRTNKKLVKEMKHHQKFVDRFGSKASLASRAQNKVKHISRLRSKIVKIDVDLATTNIYIPSKEAHPGVALHVEDLSIGYEENVLSKDISFSINRGEKVVIVGENGAGKSTLLKSIVGKIKPLSGEVKWWKHSSVGYYDQLTSSSLDDRNTVLDHLTESADSATSAEQILMMAGNFLFKGDDLDKRVNVLSGGERARLALAGVLLKTHNVLILDEPTNHMDVETTDGLALALKNYKGTVIFVSHARTFVSTLVDRIIEVRHESVREYMGTYDEHVENVMEMMREDVSDANSDLSDEGKSGDQASRKENYALVKEKQRELKRIDAQIQVFELEKSDILKFFFENPTDYSPPRAQRLGQLKDELEAIESKWVKISEEIEALRQN